MSVLELLSHYGSISSPILIVIGVLYIRGQVMGLKVWILEHFVQKDDVQ